jgi:hypothetical protein
MNKLVYRCSLLVLLAISGPVTADGQGLCSGFGGGRVGYDYIHQEFGAAVLRVQDVGTAYLIDSENGYLLTASHVVNDLIGKNEDMQVIMGQAPYSKFAFKIVKQFDPNVEDVALLQLVPPKAMVNVRPLDIAFVVPGYGAPLFAMGYPQYGQGAQIILRDTGASFAGSTPGGIIEVNHATEGGDSGGVLVDEYGDAIAICEEQTASNAKGRYLALESINKILGEIPVSQRMKQLEVQIASGNIDLESLKQELKKTTRGLSNLEIYVWAQSADKSPDLLNKIGPYLTCPLLPAFSERHILEAITPFMARLDALNTSTTDYAFAKKQYALGNLDAASKLAAKSAEVSPNTQHAALLKQSALLLDGAIAEQKNLGAEVIEQDVLPFIAKLDSGELKTYLVQWVATINSQKSETGHPSEPLKGWLTDTRQCHWGIRTEIHRTVYYLDATGKPAVVENATSVFSGGFANQGSAFVFENLRPENCGDADGRYKTDLKDAHVAVGSVFEKVVKEDRDAVKSELSRLPHVKELTTGPESDYGTGLF